MIRRKLAEIVTLLTIGAATVSGGCAKECPGPRMLVDELKIEIDYKRPDEVGSNEVVEGRYLHVCIRNDKPVYGWIKGNDYENGEIFAIMEGNALQTAYDRATSEVADRTFSK